MSVFFDVAGVDGALRRKSRLRGEVTAVGRHGAAQRRRANVRQLLVVGDSSLFAVQLVMHLLPVRHDAHDCRNLPQPTITRMHIKQHRAAAAVFSCRYVAFSARTVRTTWVVVKKSIPNHFSQCQSRFLAWLK